MNYYIAVWHPPRRHEPDGPVVLGFCAADRKEAEAKALKDLEETLKELAEDSDELGELHVGPLGNTSDEGIDSYFTWDVDIYHEDYAPEEEP